MALDTEEIMRQARERMRETQERLARMRTKVEESRITVRSPDKMITAVVDGQGELISITFTTAKWRRLAPAELGAALVKTINKAREDARAELERFYSGLRPEGVHLGGAARAQETLREMLSELLEGGSADE